MAYVTVPKDLTKVKTKVALNLIKRQLVCFSMAAVVGVPLFFFIRDSVPQSEATFIMVLAMLPFFLFVMYEKHGQPLETILGNIIRVFFLTPKERPYQTENYYAVLEKQQRLKKEVTAIAKKSIKDKPQKQQAKEKVKLTRAEKNQIAALMRQAKGNGKRHTVQQTIPYETMYPDEICRIRDNLFSKSIAFSDINYQLAQSDDKTATFEALCDFYNLLDSSICLQLTFVNRVARQRDFSQ